MSIVRCQCGSTTNSAVSEYWNSRSLDDGLARGCYAAWVDGQWQRGCLYGQADVLMKKMADDLMASTQPKEGA